jgi:hypothetical protein
MRRICGRALHVIAVFLVSAAIACASPGGRPLSDATIPALIESTTPASPATADLGTPSPRANPVVEVRTVNETQPIALKTTTIKDPSLPIGTTMVRTQGVPGTMTLTYEVTFTDGVETSKTLLRQVVTKAPTIKVVVIGTKKPSCDPNYSGACVPIASDVDCAGGNGRRTGLR